MKTIATFILSSVLLLGTGACTNTARTSADAPTSTEKAGETPTEQSVQDAKDDATSEVRRKQLESDIRAREQRNNATGGDADRADSDLSSQVRSKLEANIPRGNLAVDAKDGALVVSGTVQSQDELNKIEPLAKAIKGVKSVDVQAKVAPAVPNKN